MKKSKIEIKVRMLRKQLEKDREKFIDEHKNDKCAFTGYTHFAACSRCNGLYHDHDPSCDDWKWLWTWSVMKRDE